MGFYLRKSIRVGPLRFNLSSSGIGVSAGIPGLRFGTGPRGNYVHMGRGGFYFRKTLSSRSGSSPNQPPGSPSLPLQPRATTTPLEEIDSASVLSMTDSSNAELLAELNDKRQLTRMLPFVALLGLVSVGVGLVLHASIWVDVAVGGLFLIGSWYVHQRDQLRKTTVLFYQFDEQSEKPYQQLHAAFDEIRGCAGVWHIDARGQVLDGKYHAGASSVVTRKRILPALGAPPLLKTNIDVPMLVAGRQTLAFMPDRVLVFESAGVGAVAYDALKAEAGETQFIEEQGVPSDANVVGQTWRYVNKKGGPDRRFSHNPEIPIVQYGQFALQSGTGLNELFQASRVQAVKLFTASLAQLVGPAAQPTSHD